MSFSHLPYHPKRTICAIATPAGDGGVAIVRISGAEALKIADKVASISILEVPSHTVRFGHVLNQKMEKVDQVLFLVMKGPKSFTGEDTVEIHCHGGRMITRQVLQLCMDAGALAAEPGEFTFKAFINGKMDLSEAEAVQELIGAKSEKAAEIASSQLEGALSKKIKGYKKSLFDIAAILEAWVDFPEEGLEFASNEELCAQLSTLLKEINGLLQTYHDGKILHDGLNLCLLGRPNVGKSSLMNALLDHERAIVTDIAGTTRDVIEAFLSLKGIQVKLTDTAGIRETEEIVEKEGIRRSKLAAREADLILYLLDAQEGVAQEDAALIAALPKEKTLLVFNKVDLAGSGHENFEDFPCFSVSALHKIGTEALKEAILSGVLNHPLPGKGEVFLTSLRHKEALEKSKDSIERVLKGLENEESPELLTFDIRQGLKYLGNVIGSDLTEDLLGAIFSKFCIGK